MREGSGYTLKDILDRKKIRLEVQYLRLMLIIAALENDVECENIDKTIHKRGVRKTSEPQLSK